ncbi:MAG: LuxR C-terminal-related transcriptional regulator [Spirochaetaceae bacterium]|jgi:LuxR family maltose regulon positive regulatory protein|nr:LuxR C-terminal-related transcriptional regulator [Spirochaetaceae bacterium]
MSIDSENQRFLERPRVDHLLEEALKSHVVIIVAGEGTGKTHAVNTFLQKKNRKTIWVQLSDRDNLGWHYWENYTGEVARLNPEAAKIYADMGFPESGRQFERYLSLLESEIVSHERYVIVFDDFHFITNPSILTHLERTLAAPVSKNTIVFISRTESAMNIVHLMAKGLLSRVSVEDLRFTREETNDFFRLHDIRLEEEDLTRIFQKTEGWALALVLIIQGIKAEVADGYRWDRIMQPIKKMEENIFSAMEKELQKFLIKLSLIEHWPRNLLERIEPGGKSIAAMEKISSVIRFDVYLHGFRIHHLFLDFLREKQQYLSWEEIREIYSKDAQWCLENNLPTDAAVDYERAGDYGGFVRLIEFLPRMQPRVVASFFLEMAERLIAAHREDPSFQEEEDWDFYFLRFITHARLLALLDRFEEAEGEFQAGIAWFEAKPPSPRRSWFLSAAYNRLGILRLFTSRYNKDYNFTQCFERGYQYYLENPKPVQGQTSQLNISSYVIQVGFPADPGEIDAYINTCSASVPYASVSMGGFFFGADTLARSELAYFQGDLNKAEQFARQAVYQGREKNQYEVENRALLYLMRIVTHKGDTAAIREVEQQMKALLEKSDYLNRYITYDIFMGRFYTRIGLIEKVAPWLRAEQGEGELNVLFRGSDILIKVRCLFAEKNYPAALQTLEKEQDELGSFLLGFLEMTAMEAIIRHQLGDQEGAFRALERAYAAAAPNNLDTPFVELGEHMSSLVNALLKVRTEEAGGGKNTAEGIPRDWLQSIRNRASAYAKKRSLVADQYAGRDTSVVPVFSDWERDILNNLSQGCTAEELAARLNISVKMVKSAIRSVYTKLGVVNRADAIRIATSKGLLTDPDLSKPLKDG